MKGRGLFIAGTDTGVGKTWTTLGLLRHLRGTGANAVGMKPVECGGREDAKAILSAGGLDDLDLVNPCWRSETVAPAALTDAPTIDFDVIDAAFRLLASRHEIVLVEGAGGWLVPLDRDRTMADLAARIGLPVLVVAANRLGVLNHVLLTVRAIAASGLPCRGVYLNGFAGDNEDVSRSSNARVLRECLDGLPVIEGAPSALEGLLGERRGSAGAIDPL